METKAKCILVMVAMCVLIMPAFSQGGERDGRNGNPGSNMGQEQDNAMMSGANGAPSGHGGDIQQGQAPDAPRFKGCNTRPQKMFDKEPINPSSNPSSDKPNGLENKLGPQGVSHDEPASWSYVGKGDEKNDDAFFGFAGQDKHVPSRSIMAHNGPKAHPKKSLMEKKHEKKLKMKPKKPLRHLKHNDFPEMPPMKSIMDHRR
jgi:hypothetical protein